jgi:adenosine deaminase CECR1
LREQKAALIETEAK